MCCKWKIRSEFQRQYLRKKSPAVFYIDCCLVTKSCPTVWDPMDCSLPGSSIHGILQARILEWVATAFSRGQRIIPFSGDFPHPGVKPGFPMWQTDSLPSEPPGKLLSFPVPHFLPSSYRAPTTPRLSHAGGVFWGCRAPPHPTVWPHTVPCSVHPHTSSTHFPLGQASFSTGHSRLQVRAHDPISGPWKIFQYICRI